MTAGGHRRDSNTDIARMVELVTELGPRIPEIARRIGRHKESVRYWYKEKLLDRGFAVQATFNHERLGLKRVIIVAEFASEYEYYAQSMLTAMSELAYVMSFAKTLLGRAYIINASVPRDLLDSWIEFVRGLEQKGLLRLDQLLIFDWFRNVPMRAELYDFDTGIWNFDWSSARAANPGSVRQAAEETERVDRLDLLVLQQLFLDANSSLTEIADKLKVNYKTLNWHFKNHVLARGLTKGYRINWAGTRYDYKLERVLNRKHRYMWVDLLASGVAEKERMEMMARANTLPFMWSEAAGRGTYFAEFPLPIDSLTEALQFLQEGIPVGEERTKLYLMDQTKALAFSIAPTLYDEEQMKWTFNGQELASRFENLLIKIKSERG